MTPQEEKKLRQIIRSHCCRGCDGYGCPNDGAGEDTDKIVQIIIKGWLPEIIENVRE